MLKFDKTKRRRKIFGTHDRPRLSIFRSNKEIYSQIIDDISGKSLVSASSFEKCFKKESFNKIEQSIIVGQELGRKSLMAGIKKVVFDRNGYSYHGRIKYLAEAAKDYGLEF
jgi:large subunit ribosomal protein L18